MPRRIAAGERPPPGSMAAAEPFRSQRGAALIALVLALALGSGLVSVRWLEAAARSSHNALRSEASLLAARDALIGYAASYPDQHRGRHGPGYLPCPDTSGNGSPNTPCRARSIGWLPWRRLGLHDPRDGSGERLWYSLADRFRANGYKHRPLNVETAAELVVDGRSGIAAVIIAPEAPLSFQDRAGHPLDVAQYLEAGNESPHDGLYVSDKGPHPGPGTVRDRLNDRLTGISRDELMAAAARRVLAAVRGILQRYPDAPWNAGSFPWLAPWNVPADIAMAVPGVTAGRLPIVPIGGEFPTSFRVAGSLPGHRPHARGTADSADVTPFSIDRRVPDGRCKWSNANRIDCNGESRSVLGSGQERVFRFNLHFTGDVTVTPPGPADVRRRSVQGIEWVGASDVDIIDVLDGAETGRARLRFEPGPVEGTLEVQGVAYPLGIGEEVPTWLYENRWHHALLVAIAPSYAAGGERDCNAPARCLAVVRTTLDGRTDERRAIAVVLYAGPALPGQRRETPDLSHWFEGDNANPVNFRYETQVANEGFNDRISVIASPPGVFNP